MPVDYGARGSAERPSTGPPFGAFLVLSKGAKHTLRGRLYLYIDCIFYSSALYFFQLLLCEVDMSRKSWRMFRLRRRQRRQQGTFHFEGKSVTVSGKGRIYRQAKAAVAMHLSAEEAGRFMEGRRGW